MTDWCILVDQLTYNLINRLPYSTHHNLIDKKKQHNNPIDILVNYYNPDRYRPFIDKQYTKNCLYNETYVKRKQEEEEEEEEEQEEEQEQEEQEQSEPESVHQQQEDELDKDRETIQIEKEEEEEEEQEKEQEQSEPESSHQQQEDELDKDRETIQIKKKKLDKDRETIQMEKEKLDNDRKTIEEEKKKVNFLVSGLTEVHIDNDKNNFTKHQLNMYNIQKEKNHCCVCLEIDKTIMLDPCKHVCVCEKCSSGLVVCPLCRTQITNKTKVYI